MAQAGYVEGFKKDPETLTTDRESLYDDRNSVMSSVISGGNFTQYRGSDMGSVTSDMDDKADKDDHDDDDDDEEEEPEELPEWACSFCSISDPMCVAKCSSTGKWFCNGAVGTSGSCIVHHLVRGRYKELSLHPNRYMVFVIAISSSLFSTLQFFLRL